MFSHSQHRISGLLSIELLSDLPDYLPKSLRDQARAATVKKRKTLYRVNDPVTSIYYVRRGELEAVRYSPEGESLVMVRARAGEFFGEAALAVDSYVCDGHARIDSELLVLPKPAMLSALRDDPGFATAFLLAQIKNARRQCSRYERVRLRRAEDRIVHYLICETTPEGRSALSGSLADWAAELGLQPESLYRSLARLRAEGRIEGEGSALCIR